MPTVGNGTFWVSCWVAKGGAWSSDIPIRPGSILIHDGPQHDAALLWGVIACAAMHGRPLVPDQEIADLPGMIVDETILRRMCCQLLDQRPGFFLLHADKAM